MTQRNRSGVCRIGWLWHLVEPKSLSDHLADLILACATPAGDGVLHLRRCVLHDLAPRARRERENNAAGLRSSHRRAHVCLEKHLLDCNCCRAELSNQAIDVIVNLGQAVSQWLGRRSADYAQGQRPGLTGVVHPEDRIPASGQAGVDPEHHMTEHMYDCNSAQGHCG